MGKTIKLIHDKFENEWGFIEGTPLNNINHLIDELNKIYFHHYPDTIYS